MISCDDRFRLALGADECDGRPVDWLVRVCHVGSVRGCTTNPPLSLQAVKSDTQFWNEWLDDRIRSGLDLSLKELTWLTYKEVVKRGAQL